MKKKKILALLSLCAAGVAIGAICRCHKKCDIRPVDDDFDVDPDEERTVPNINLIDSDYEEDEEPDFDISTDIPADALICLGRSFDQFGHSITVETASTKDCIYNIAVTCVSANIGPNEYIHIMQMVNKMVAAQTIAIHEDTDTYEEKLLKSAVCDALVNADPDCIANFLK